MISVEGGRIVDLITAKYETFNVEKQLVVNVLRVDEKIIAKLKTKGEINDFRNCDRFCFWGIDN